MNKQLALASKAGGVRKRWGALVPDPREQYELKRHVLLETAAQLINERGFHAASVSELAKRLSVTKPTLYYYVKNKADLAIQILKLSHARADSLRDVALSTDLSGLQRLRAFLRLYVAFMTTPVGACTLQLATQPRANKYLAKMSAALRPIEEWMRGILADGVRDGSIGDCDPRMVDFAVFGALHWIPRWYKRDGAMSPDEIADGLFRVFAGGLAPRECTSDAGAVPAAAGGRNARLEGLPDILQSLNR